MYTCSTLVARLFRLVSSQLRLEQYISTAVFKAMLKLLFFSSKSPIVIPATVNNTACCSPSEGGDDVEGERTDEEGTVTTVDETSEGWIVLVFKVAVVMTTTSVELDPSTVELEATNDEVDTTGVTDVALPVCKWKEIKKIWKERSVHMVQVKEYIATFKPD